ncbi:recombinase family protein [Candidatus Microgenomates bacterium]|nr:recombinase family protein [Candidatus Microgenomates bacterium]
MRKIAIYVRVSTGEQDTDNQITPLSQYTTDRGWEVYKIYEDKVSGSKEDREALKELMDDAHKRKFDCIIVFRFDRFSRSSRQLINSLDVFKSLGIDFISYQENIDTTTPAGKAMFTMISAFAEFERSIIRERVNAGIAKARARGTKLGRPKIKIDIDLLKKLKNKGLSIRKIAKELEVPKSTVHSHLCA